MLRWIAKAFGFAPAAQRSLTDPPRLIADLPTNEGILLDSVVFSPDGTALAAGHSSDSNEYVTVWDVASHRVLLRLHGHTEPVREVVFLADGQTLATASDDHTVKLWDVVTGNELKSLSGHSSSVVSLAVSANGILASGSSDDTVKLWDVTDRKGKELRTIHARMRQVCSVAISSDGMYVVAGGLNGELRVWGVDFKTGVGDLRGHRGSLCNVRSAAGGYLCASSAEGQMRDMGDGMHWEILPGEILLWHLQKRKKLRTIAGLDGITRAVAISSDGRTLATGTDKTIRLWDTGTGMQLAEMHGHPSKILALCWSPDNRLLASVGEDAAFKLWSIPHDKPLAV